MRGKYARRKAARLAHDHDSTSFAEFAAEQKAAHPVEAREAQITVLDKQVIEQLWATNVKSADYSFNRSHAACYGLIAYRTAWLKANYPAEYMAALISSVMSTKDKVPFFATRAEQMADRMVQRRLGSDRDYFNARNADDQQEAEDKISEQVWREIEGKYDIV